MSKDSRLAPPVTLPMLSLQVYLGTSCHLFYLTHHSSGTVCWGKWLQAKYTETIWTLFPRLHKLEHDHRNGIAADHDMLWFEHKDTSTSALVPSKVQIHFKYIYLLLVNNQWIKMKIGETCLKNEPKGFFYQCNELRYCHSLRVNYPYTCFEKFIFSLLSISEYSLQ